MDFEHAYVHTVHWRMVRCATGLPKLVLRVVARIPLDPRKPGYNAERLESLRGAIASFSERVGSPFAGIELVQGMVDA